ncbi:MAG TPA: LUD domain-containing protein [Thermohalobaculum sp.]|nr:LUD domain-containing protein [Thermohalobaculum sp.]
MSARDRILARVTRATGGGDKVAVAARLGHHLAHAAPIPVAAQTIGPARIAQFIAKATAVDTTVSRIASLEDLPKALAEELRSRNLPAAIRTGHDPIFERDWGTVEHSTGPGRLDEPATLSRAHLGMAETGTVVLASGAENPVTLTFLGETHFVVIAAADIKAGFEDMWAEWRKRGLDPRTVNLVTGPSRSADIGQTLQLGAHGPVAVHVFVVG